MANDDEAMRRLSQLVRDHQVVFEVQRLRRGVDVKLYGIVVAHGRGAALQPGSERCWDTWENLRAIAEAALPQERRECSFLTEGFRPALTYDPKRQWRPDVELVLEIRNSLDFLAPTGKCHEICRDDILDALRGLGVREATWMRGTVTVAV